MEIVLKRENYNVSKIASEHNSLKRAALLCTEIHDPPQVLSLGN